MTNQPALFPIPGPDEDRENPDEKWFRLAMAAVHAIAATGHIFQAYDLLERYNVPEPSHYNRWGDLLRRARREGLIVPVGAAPSRRPTTCGSLTRTWRGAAA